MHKYTRGNYKLLYNILLSYDWLYVYTNTSLQAAVSSLISTLHEAIDHSMTLGPFKRSNFPLRFSLYRKLVKAATKFVFAAVLVVDWCMEKAFTVRCDSKKSSLLVKMYTRLYDQISLTKHITFISPQLSVETQHSLIKHRPWRSKRTFGHRTELVIIEMFNTIIKDCNPFSNSVLSCT